MRPQGASQPDQAGGHQHRNGGPGESIVALLRCLRAAAPGAVTYRYLEAVLGIEAASIRSVACRLRDRGVPVIDQRGVGYSLSNEWRDAGGSSPGAALRVSVSGSAALHGRILNGDAQ